MGDIEKQLGYETAAGSEVPFSESEFPMCPWCGAVLNDHNRSLDLVFSATPGLTAALCVECSEKPIGDGWITPEEKEQSSK